MEFKFQCSRCAFVIFRDFQIGIAPMRKSEGGITSSSGVFYFHLFSFHYIGLLHFWFHFAFEDMSKWGWLLGMRTQQHIFVVVFILTMEDRGINLDLDPVDFKIHLFHWQENCLYCLFWPVLLKQRCWGKFRKDS